MLSFMPDPRLDLLEIQVEKTTAMTHYHEALRENEEKHKSSVPENVITQTALHLERLIAQNPTHNLLKKPYETSSIPSMSIKDFLVRINKFAKPTVEIFTVIFIYLERFFENNPGYCLTNYNVHRLLITALSLARKISSDDCDDFVTIINNKITKLYNNEFMAYLGGMKRPEINKLEIDFYSALQYEAFYHEYQLRKYERLILSLNLTPAPQTSVTAATKDVKNDTKSAVSQVKLVLAVANSPLHQAKPALNIMIPNPSQTVSSSVKQ